MPIFFKHENYGSTGGYAFPLSDKDYSDGEAKEYTLSDLKSLGMDNDKISSVYVPTGYKVTLYKNDNFAGDSIVLTAPESSLKEEGFNNNVSSIKVKRLE